MCKILLVRPSKQYAGQVMSYKEEMSQNGDSFDGCAGLENVQSFEDWIDFEARLKAKGYRRHPTLPAKKNLTVHSGRPLCQRTVFFLRACEPER